MKPSVVSKGRCLRRCQPAHHLIGNTVVRKQRSPACRRRYNPPPLLTSITSMLQPQLLAPRQVLLASDALGTQAPISVPLHHIRSWMRPTVKFQTPSTNPVDSLRSPKGLKYLIFHTCHIVSAYSVSTQNESMVESRVSDQVAAGYALVVLFVHSFFCSASS